MKKLLLLPILLLTMIACQKESEGVGVQNVEVQDFDFQSIEMPTPPEISGVANKSIATTCEIDELLQINSAKSEREGKVTITHAVLNMTLADGTYSNYRASYRDRVNLEPIFGYDMFSEWSRWTSFDLSDECTDTYRLYVNTDYNRKIVELEIRLTPISDSGEVETFRTSYVIRDFDGCAEVPPIEELKKPSTNKPYTDYLIERLQQYPKKTFHINTIEGVVGNIVKLEINVPDVEYLKYYYIHEYYYGGGIQSIHKYPWKSNKLPIHASCTSIYDLEFEDDPNPPTDTTWRYHYVYIRVFDETETAKIGYERNRQDVRVLLEGK